MARGDEPDYDQLEEALRALAYATRLQLVRQLRVPQTLGDLRLRPRRGAAAAHPATMSKQSVHEHLAKLVEAGLVGTREAERGGRRVKEYVVNTPRLYHLMEEFRRLGRIAVGPGDNREATLQVEGATAPAAEPGPKLVLVLGLLEGKVFPLRRPDLREGRGWVLGRKAGLGISLAYDPYVSLENSEIVPEEGQYMLFDLRASRNGTWLNWRRLGRDERAPLQPGDVIGVGRSLLVFRAA